MRALLSLHFVYELTYPLFHLIRNFTDSIENLFLIGRNGMHKYNNQDHSMLAAMTAAAPKLQLQQELKARDDPAVQAVLATRTSDVRASKHQKTNWSDHNDIFKAAR